ncbi:hypothetical protein GALMADRAFT_141537 [Galerina marginata CBS 339.88]|uniref:F-box domain-containing protein n=1 Tax=Galerina marginata (strain CBS 339.88) TaxID=685588 RepID=A0A067SWU6_GALM3|nr:hypothetical protein GALMADRAFT_141537 [Galerina marginata CBS 339.88]
MDTTTTINCPSSPFRKLLPELFPVVAGHLPLYATPATLLSLALTNHDIHNIVYPLLCSRVILRNEDDALNFLQMILIDGHLGTAIRELHIMSGLSKATRSGERPFDVVKVVEMVITRGSLPHIHTFSLHLLATWVWDNDYVSGHGKLSARFWRELPSKCPRLRGITVRGMGDKNEPWLNESGIYELNGMREMSHLGFTFYRGFQSQKDGGVRLMASIRHVSSSLRTLVLGLNYESCSPLLSLDFPRLTSLTLLRSSCSDDCVPAAMAFWRRHSSLEGLKLSDSLSDSLWFDETTRPGILPNLRHLEANFKNVYAIAPILRQLIGLSIQQSVNGQILYLLRRSMIPGGLPNLRSLEFQQYPYSGRYLSHYEGSMWYETPDGEEKFHLSRESEGVGRSIDNDYLRTIARQTPNLEEIAIQATFPNISSLIPSLTRFRCLERLYCRGTWSTADNIYDASEPTEADLAAFFTEARLLAEGCKSLKLITDMSLATSYPTVKIRRSQDGLVKDVKISDGYGRLIGHEDDPFPLPDTRW